MIPSALRFESVIGMHSMALVNNSVGYFEIAEKSGHAIKVLVFYTLQSVEYLVRILSINGRLSREPLNIFDMTKQQTY